MTKQDVINLAKEYGLTPKDILNMESYSDSINIKALSKEIFKKYLTDGTLNGRIVNQDPNTWFGTGSGDITNLRYTLCQNNKNRSTMFEYYIDRIPQGNTRDDNYWYYHVRYIPNWGNAYTLVPSHILKTVNIGGKANYSEPTLIKDPVGNNAAYRPIFNFEEIIIY